MSVKFLRVRGLGLWRTLCLSTVCMSLCVYLSLFLFLCLVSTWRTLMSRGQSALCSLGSSRLVLSRQFPLAGLSFPVSIFQFLCLFLTGSLIHFFSSPFHESLVPHHPPHLTARMFPSPHLSFFSLSLILLRLDHTFSLPPLFFSSSLHSIPFLFFFFLPLVQCGIIESASLTWCWSHGCRRKDEEKEGSLCVHVTL